ncbi:MAG: DMT family transporter [Anaerolineae bacterium]
MNNAVTATPALDARRAGMAGMIGASVLFSLMAALIRSAHNVDSSVFALSRFAVGLACIAAGVAGGVASLSFVNRKLLVARGLLGGAGVTIFYASIVHLGLAKGTVISYSYPIFAALIGAATIGEHLGGRQVSAIAVAFVGLVLTVGGNWTDLGAVGGMEALALLGAVLAGAVIVIIRKLRETDTTSTIFMAQCLVGLALVAGPAGRVDWNLTPAEWGILAGVGLFAAAGQLLMTHSYKYLPVAQGAVLGMLTPVFNVLLGISLFHETMTLPSGMGMLLVLWAGFQLNRDHSPRTPARRRH